MSEPSFQPYGDLSFSAITHLILLLPAEARQDFLDWINDPGKKHTLPFSIEVLHQTSLKQHLNRKKFVTVTFHGGYLYRLNSLYYFYRFVNMKVVYTPYKTPTYLPGTIPLVSTNWLTRIVVIPILQPDYPHREHY